MYILNQQQHQWQQPDPNVWREQQLTSTASSSLAAQQFEEKKAASLGFLQANNPDTQIKVCGNEALCYAESGDNPTLRGLDETYLPTTSCSWVAAQLIDLSEFCGAKEKLTEESSIHILNTLAAMLAQEYSYLRIREMMLFFYRFKLGRYGKVYGTIVDPMAITTALQTFMKERNAFFSRREAEENKRRVLAELSDENNITYAEYCRRHRKKSKSQYLNITKP